MNARNELTAVLLTPSVCASLSDPSPSGAAVRVKNGCEFVFGRVGFVFGHDCLHCEAVLVVYKIGSLSLLVQRISSRFNSSAFRTVSLG